DAAVPVYKAWIVEAFGAPKLGHQLCELRLSEYREHYITVSASEPVSSWQTAHREVAELFMVDPGDGIVRDQTREHVHERIQHCDIYELASSRSSALIQ